MGGRHQGRRGERELSDQFPAGTTSRAGARSRRVTALDGNDRALLRKGLVVLLDVLEIVQVVHHQAVRLRAAPARSGRRAN